MTQRVLILMIVGFLVAGITLIVLPGKWIELWLGSSPDAGSGLLEFLLPVALFVIGLGLHAVLALRNVVTARHQKRRTQSSLRGLAS